MSEIVLSGLVVPILTSLLATLVTSLSERHQQRDREDRLRRAIAQAQEQVTFIDTWLRAHERVAPEDAHRDAVLRSREHLGKAYQVLELSLESSPLDAHARSIGEVLRSVLLLQPLSTTKARRNRVYYYIALCWVVVWSATGWAATAQEPGPVTAGDVAISIAMVIVFSLVPAIAFRVRVLRLEREGPPPAPTPPQQGLYVSPYRTAPAPGPWYPPPPPPPPPRHYLT